MTRGAIVTLLVTLAAPAAAQDSATLLLGSHHVGATADFEEVNPGLILTWDRDPLDWSIGVYRNSYGRQTVAGFASLPVMSGDLSLSLVGGLAHYPGDGRHFAVHAGDWVPLIGVHLQAGPVSALIMPSDGKATDAVIAVGITWELP